MWNEICDNEKLALFMKYMGFFHDSCIKEMQYTSGAYVQECLSMYPVNDKRILRVVVQRQAANPSAIEMKFVGLKHLRLYPADEEYTCEILGAAMFLKDNCVIWCDSDDVSEIGLDAYEGTVICAEKVFWRETNEYIGPKQVYCYK